MRYFIQFGAPLDMTSQKNLDDDSKKGERYKDITDRQNEQKQYAADFQYEIIDILDKFTEDNPNDIEVTITSAAVY